MFSLFYAYAVGILVVLALMSRGVSAEIQVGEATIYSGKRLRSGKEKFACDLSSQWKNKLAVISQETFEEIKNPCSKCVVINGVSTQENSRRFKRGVYAKIADTCTGEDCEQGSLRLSSSVMKAISSSAQDDAPVVSWEIVDCPRTSNLRGRKLI